MGKMRADKGHLDARQGERHPGQDGGVPVVAGGQRFSFGQFQRTYFRDDGAEIVVVRNSKGEELEFPALAAHRR